MENAYAKKALQLYIAVTSEVEVRETARNHVLAAIVRVIVKCSNDKKHVFLRSEVRTHSIWRFGEDMSCCYSERVEM